MGSQRHNFRHAARRHHEQQRRDAFHAHLEYIATRAQSKRAEHAETERDDEHATEQP